MVIRGLKAKRYHGRPVEVNRGGGMITAESIWLEIPDGFGPRAAERLRELGYRFGWRGTVPDVPPGVPVVGMGALYEPERHDPMLIPSGGLAVPEWTLDDFKKVTAPAVRGKVLVFQFHGTPDGAHPFCSTPAERYVEFLDHLKAEGFTVIAMRDLERYFDFSKRPKDPLMEKVHFFGNYSVDYK
ncbi:MAG: hypothetical protein ABFR33_01050 [Verrucomicrobiota bacterium]